MLEKCPECELQVSSKAATCPHCGYPLKPQHVSRPRVTSKQRRRLPNGFGQITKIREKKLRNPYRVMVTVGKSESGRPISKPLKPNAYFETYNDAYAALIEYHKNPYDLEDSITVKELYERWSEEYFKTLKSASSARTVTSAWAYFSDIYHMRACDVRARHIKGCMENGTCTIRGEAHHPTAGTKSRMKSLANLMFDYALEYEIVDKNYARTFNISTDIIREKEETKRGHILFTQEELQRLWDNVETMAYVDVILIQCYSGWRPQELGLLEIANVDLNNWTFTGGMKTEAGINRLVPIHSRIRPLVERRYNEALSIESKYLINCVDGTTHRDSIKFTYDKYRHRFDKICERLQLNPQHRPHDGRKQFVTMAKKANMDEYAIKYIVGHTINDITEKVYTERDVSWLQSEIEKIR